MPFIGAAILTLFVAGMLTSCDDKDAFVPETDLPAASRTYIQTHFPDVAISQVWKDKDGSRTDYEVTLVNAAFLEFDKNGTVIKLESYAGLPQSTIMPNIYEYVTVKFPTQKIIKWELEDNRKVQEVTLLMGEVELRFDLAGNFIGFDN